MKNIKEEHARNKSFVSSFATFLGLSGGLVMPDRVGQQLGKYRLVRLLGSGGFAEVYLGQHVHLASRQAAVKILHLTDVDVEAFKKEAETTVQLEHPHIVHLLDFDIEQMPPFLVLDFAPGGSLRARHTKGSIVPLARAIGYLKEIASALQYAHDNNFIHRDIKPENILIGRRNELLLSDGKPEKASDQYALGIVVYEWLSGTPPFTGSAIQLGYQHTYVEIPPLQEKNPTISPDVSAVVMTALSKVPHQRFGSVSAFTNALEQACLPSLQALPIVESTPSQSTPARISTNQVIPQEEVVSQQSEQKIAPVQPVSQKIASIPPAPPAQSMYTYTQPANPYPQPMHPVPRPYIQSPADQAKQKRNTRNKSILVVGGIGGGMVGGGVAIGIVAAKIYPGVIEYVIIGAVLGAIVGAVLGAIVGAISLAVIRKLAEKEALAFAGVKDAGIVTIAGIVAGAIILVLTTFWPTIPTYLGMLVVLAVAVVAGVVAGALVAGNVRKKFRRRE